MRDSALFFLFTIVSALYDALNCSILNLMIKLLISCINVYYKNMSAVISSIEFYWPSVNFLMSTGRLWDGFGTKYVLKMFLRRPMITRLLLSKEIGFQNVSNFFRQKKFIIITPRKTLKWLLTVMYAFDV